MGKLPKSETSYWESSVIAPPYLRLQNDLNVDVVIIGGGIAGLSVGYLLKQAKKTVAVIDKNSIGRGVTNNTTGKITSQHNLIYGKLYDSIGAKNAQNYGQANEAALKEINKIIITENIECDWQRDDNYVYTTKQDQIKKFKREADIAQRLGLPASLEAHTSLPFEVKAAVKFSNQAKFHVKKYLMGLAKAIDKDGSHVLESTRASPVGIRDGHLCMVKTSGGAILAKDIIIATNVPFTAGSRGSYCVMEYPQKSYIVAGRPKKAVEGMYISPDEGHYSILPIRNGEERLLLIGGESHIPGLGGSPDKHYLELAKYASKYFGVDAIDYRWSARDYMSYDNVPLVGKLYPWSKHVYTTTAYMKWGLTNTMVSAMILRDKILGENNPYTKTFSSMRIKPIASIPKVFASYVGLR